MPAKTIKLMTLFDDIPRDYAGFPREAETLYSYYNRSARPESESVRRMLQRWLDHLPLGRRRSVIQRMRRPGYGSPTDNQQGNAAFFEMFLHEFLNGAGHDAMMQPGLAPMTSDFAATGPGADGAPISYTVAVADMGNTPARNALWNEKIAEDVLNEIVPAEYVMYVTTQGYLALPPRPEELKAAFAELIRDADYDALLEQGVDDVPRASYRQDGWSIEGRLLPATSSCGAVAVRYQDGERVEYRPEPEATRRVGDRVVAWEPSARGVFDPQEMIRNELNATAALYRDCPNLVIAAHMPVDCWHLCQLEEAMFASATYQPTHQQAWADEPAPLPPTAYRERRFWLDPAGARNRHVIGVLGFDMVYPHCPERAEAVYYPNPYARRPLPSWASEVDSSRVPARRKPYDYMRGRVTGAAPTGG